MRGIITNVVDHGTIVTVTVLEAERLGEHDFHFDHRMFGHMLEAEGGIANIEGREVRVHEDHAFHGQGPAFEFDPDPEDADAEADQVAAPD